MLSKKLNYVYVPLIFMIIGYGVIWILGRQQIDFVVSTTSLLLLNDAPKVAGKKIYKSEVPATDNEVPKSSITYPRENDQFGEIVSEEIGLRVPLLCEDSTDNLAKGAGMSLQGCFPGEVGTVLIGMHNRPEGQNLPKILDDQTFSIKTNYGTFLYKVLSHKIIPADIEGEKFISDQLTTDERKVVLYTCFPFEAIGFADSRYVLIGQQIGGLKIDSTK